MKMLIAVAVAGVLLATGASAQTASAPTSCGAVPEMPTLPDGATATREQMTRANDRFNEWNASARAVIECRHNEVGVLQAQWQALVSEHNAMVESVNGANANWRAEADEFNARNANRNERQLRQPTINGG